MIPTWHGLTFEQWIKLWDNARWRTFMMSALIDVSVSPDAKTGDRLLALQSINEAIMAGVFPPDADFPRFMRDILIDISMGTRRRSWFHRRKSRALHARLIGARWMLKTAYQFLPDPGERPTQPILTSPENANSNAN